MTSSEAIEMLAGMYLVGTEDKRSKQEHVKKHNDAIEYAIGRLMKRRPTQDGTINRCPRCKTLVYRFQNGCEKCQQALDWRKYNAE